MGQNRIFWGCGGTLVISKCFPKSEFQTLEPNFAFGAVNEGTIELLQTSLQH